MKSAVTARQLMFLLSALLATATNVGAQADGSKASAMPPRHAVPLLALKVAAKDAATGSEEAIGAFVDVLIDSTIFSGAAPSLRARLIKSEIQARTTGRGWIREQTLVTQFNEMVRYLDLPVAMETSREQIHLVRQDLRFFIQNFAFTRSDRGEVYDAVSASEALLLLSHLATQKVYNPEFMVSAHEWVETANRNRELFKDRLSAEPTKPAVSVRSVDTRLVEMLAAVQQGAADEGGPVMTGIHKLMDEAGVPR